MKNCFICDKKTIETLSCKQGTVLVCPECGLGVMKDFPKKEKVLNFYEKFYDEKESQRFNYLFEKAILFFRYLRLKKVQKYGKKGKLLDIGFGRTTDLEIFKKNGWEAYGTQIVPHTVAIAKKKGLNAFLGELTDAKYPKQSFDTVTIWHVLEHLPEPEVYIKEIKRILAPEGKLIIEVPNFQSPIAKYFKCDWFSLDLPHHLYQFTPPSLTKLLNKHGFSVQKIGYFSIEQSPFSAMQSVLNRITGKRNAVFEAIKKQGEQTNALTIVSQLFLAAVITPFALIAAIILGIMKKGDVMTLYCTKK